MIKELIKDISYDNISLSQALTRAKLIAAKVKNITYRDWINMELEGYSYDEVPHYRKLHCETNLRVEFQFGRIQSFPYVLSEEARLKDPKFAELVERHRVTEPISIIEKNLAGLTTQKGEIPLPQQFTNLISEQYDDEFASHGGVVRSSYKQIAKAQYQAIIELTKQKLLDTLLSLDGVFPNLTDDFVTTKDNIDKVQNIITTNIYGNNNPLNIASGVNVRQNSSTTTNNYSILEELGVEKKDVETLKKIIESKGTDKLSIKTKVFKWLGSVSASVAAKGLADKIPSIIEYVEKLVN